MQENRQKITKYHLKLLFQLQDFLNPNSGKRQV